MNRFINIILLLQIPLLVNCNSNTTNKRIANLEINNFDMNHYANDGSIIYSVKSPISEYIVDKQTLILSKTNIKLFHNNEVKYIIKADNSNLKNNNKIVELIGNINVLGFSTEKEKLTADNFLWNINESEFTLKGNVNFENDYILLNSNKAKLDKESNLITFFNPVNYSIKDGSENSKLEISAEDAFYDIKNKNVIFKSKEKRVKSKFYY